jgi:hypothetical protein
MGKILVALLVLIAAPVEVLAQRPGRHSRVVSPQGGEVPPRWTITPRTGSPAEGYPRDPLPHFTIPPRHGSQPPLPSIGLPLPPIGLHTPHFARNRFARHHRGRGFVSPFAYPLYVVPPYPYVEYVEMTTPVAVPVPTVVEAARPSGSLTLDVQPGNAQVFVDGYYVGTPDDLAINRGALALEPGPHKVDLTAPGYEPVSFDVRLTGDQPITYSRSLKRIEVPDSPRPAAAPAPAGPMTFYLIPGCYMGNVPPKDARLPSTCDVSRVITFQP